jgi:hypothetical protein
MIMPDADRPFADDTEHASYDPACDARAQPDPRATVLDFYESACQAGARLAGWDIQRLASPGGITDPGCVRTRADRYQRLAAMACWNPVAQEYGRPWLRCLRWTWSWNG